MPMAIYSLRTHCTEFMKEGNKEKKGGGKKGRRRRRKRVRVEGGANVCMVEPFYSDES